MHTEEMLEEAKQGTKIGMFTLRDISNIKQNMVNNAVERNKDVAQSVFDDLSSKEKLNETEKRAIHKLAVALGKDTPANAKDADETPKPKKEKKAKDEEDTDLPVERTKKQEDVIDDTKEVLDGDGDSDEDEWMVIYRSGATETGSEAKREAKRFFTYDPKTHSITPKKVSGYEIKSKNTRSGDLDVQVLDKDSKGWGAYLSFSIPEPENLEESFVPVFASDENGTTCDHCGCGECDCDDAVKAYEAGENEQPQVTIVKVDEPTETRNPWATMDSYFPN